MARRLGIGGWRRRCGGRGEDSGYKILMVIAIAHLNAGEANGRAGLARH